MCLVLARSPKRMRLAIEVRAGTKHHKMRLALPLHLHDLLHQARHAHGGGRHTSLLVCGAKQVRHVCERLPLRFCARIRNKGDTNLRVAIQRADLHEQPSRKLPHALVVSHDSRTGVVVQIEANRNIAQRRHGLPKGGNPVPQQVVLQREVLLRPIDVYLKGQHGGARTHAEEIVCVTRVAHKQRRTFTSTHKNRLDRNETQVKRLRLPHGKIVQRVLDAIQIGDVAALAHTLEFL